MSGYRGFENKAAYEAYYSGPLPQWEIDAMEAYTKESEMESTSDERTSNNAVRHQYRVLSDQEKIAMMAIKDKGLEFLNIIDSLGSKREYSLAKTKVEEAVMWAVKGLTG